MYNIAVYDEDAQSRTRLRALLSDFFAMTDRELKLYWLTSPCSRESLPSYAQLIQIAFICVETADSERFGRELYWQNPDCLLCYYGGTKRELRPLLLSRPIAFYLWQENKAGFDALVERMIMDHERQHAIFCYKTRKMQYSMPIRNIKYFQSDLRYVEIRLVYGEARQLYCKLSDIVCELTKLPAGAGFIRCHKSYLVNMQHVIGLDRATKRVVLSDGEEIPVSESQYEQTLRRVALAINAV